MKRIILLILFLFAGFVVRAQFGGFLDKAKKKAEEKVDKKVNDAGKKADDASTGKPADKNGTGETEKGEPGNSETAVPASAKTYSKFDFVPGEKIVVLEDFMQDAVGDFPDKWNTTSSGEVVTIDGMPGRWLMFTKGGVFTPEFIDSLPENFTFEFDLYCSNLGSGSYFATFYMVFAELADRDKPEDWQISSNRYNFTMNPGNGIDGVGSTNSERRKNGIGEGAVTATTKQFYDKSKPVHVSVWRQKERVRVYFNEEKVWDIPKALLKEAKLNAVLFYIQDVYEKYRYCLSNLRLAVGAPDTRNKLLTEGKWVTHGILFDVNSASIKPESYGTLKEIAGVLKENETVQVKIIGHTDSDGDDVKNMDLSKRRAASVKESLVKEFGIEEGRMKTDGLGESKPVDKNDSPAGKANNRRVEFVKI